MPVTDPIADFLTRMRNAIKANKRRVELPSSNMKVRIAEILKENHYINDYQVVEDNKQNVLRVFLKYSNGQSAINGLERISTPGLRSYSPVEKLPRVLNGMGIVIISTSKGVMTEKQAKRDNLGGEVICQIW